jgi:hypothetical protein
MNKIFAIDPGNIESGYVAWDGQNILEFGKIKNQDLLKKIYEFSEEHAFVNFTIEMVSSYGMPVGKTVFDTCVWIGRFIQFIASACKNYKLIYRIDIKNHLCYSSRAKDSNIIQSLVDRFGNVDKHGKYGKGTKKNPGFFYGFYKDIWQAFALAVYSYDNLKQ